MADRSDAASVGRPPLPGNIGAYRIESVLGAGGMGVVYRAVAPDGTTVALKTLRDHSVNPERFVREASIRIDHPNVIRVLDSGGDEHGTPYIVFELLLGRSLEQRLAEGPLRASELVPLVRQACEGLAAVHRAGIIHRDLKPANLFCCTDGTVKVLDFGIALVGGGPKLTSEGTLLGSASYLSPEQARGQRAVDPSTDVWAMGAVMYQALTGRPPFDQESAIATVLAILQQEAQPVQMLAPGTPRALGEIVDRCLCKVPAERFQDAEALERALRDVALDAEDVDTVPTDPTLAIEPSLPPGEERVVAVLLAREVDDPTPVEREIEQLGGDPVPFLGDGVVGLFGARSWEGDEIERAVAAALRCRPHARAVAVGSGRARTVATGVSGTAVGAAEIGAAARLTGVALDGATARAVSHRFAPVPAGDGLYEVSYDTRRSSAFPPAVEESSILGREAEVARLRAAVQSVIEERRAHVIDVVGPFGMGKSRLRRELETMLAEAHASVRVLSARGEPLYRESALFLWAAALRREVRARASAPSDAPRILEQLVHEAARDPGTASLQLSFLGELADIEVGDSPELHAARADAQIMADRLRLAVMDHVIGLSHAGPLALIVEDLQWADRASLDVLERIVGEVADRPVLVFLSARLPVVDTDLGEWAALPLDRIVLGGLAPPAAAELARRTVGRPLPEAVVTRLVEQTEGNPFFVEQVALTLRETAGDAPTEVPLPTTVEAAVQSRLDHLPEAARDLLKRASILGRPFSGEELSALGATDVAGSLETLRQREILVDVGASRGTDELAFVSPLMADVTYRLLTSELRAQLHARAADLLEGQRGVDHEEAASHHEKAGAPARAAACYLEAAIAAARRADSDTVLRCTERALALGVPGPRLYEVHMVRADALRFHGRRTEQGEHLDLALANANGEVQRARALAERVSWLRATGRPAEADRAGDDAVAAARASGDAEATAVALGRQADARILSGRHEDAEPLVREATEIARDLPPRVRAFVDERRAMLAHTRGDLGQALLAWARVADRYRSSGALRRAAMVQQNLADVYNRLGAYSEAEQALREALEACRRVGHGVAEVYVLANLGYAQIRRGDPERALESLEEAGELAAAMQDPRLVVCVRVYVAMALEAAGRRDEARQAADAAAEDAQREGQQGLEAMALACGARIALLEGDVTGALAEAERAVAIRDELGSLEEDEGEVFLVLVETLRASGRREAAERVRQRAVERLCAVASRIRDGKWRERYQRDVTAHRRLLEEPVSPTDR